MSGALACAVDPRDSLFVRSRMEPTAENVLRSHQRGIISTQMQRRACRSQEIRSMLPATLVSPQVLASMTLLIPEPIPNIAARMPGFNAPL